MSTSAPTYRVATLADIPAMMSIRNAVRENALVHLVLTPEDYREAMTVHGRAWVCEVDNAVAGFSCGRRVPGDIWALFLRESQEGRGIGGALMDRVEAWMFGEGLEELWLVTSPDTRAERLYQRRGWQAQGATSSGEAKYVLRRDASAGSA